MGAKRILLIDDEEQVRDCMDAMLQYLGYEVICYADGWSAADYYRENWRYVDVVIIDMMMPKLSGIATFSLLKKINPEVRAILASGYSLGSDMQAGLESGVSGFLYKPFDKEGLEEVLSVVIES